MLRERKHPITKLSSFTNFNYVVYDLVLIPKSSITADTAFRKDLSLQGCTTLPTRANRLLMPRDQTSSLGGRQRVEGYTLFVHKSIHDSSMCRGRRYQSFRMPGPTWPTIPTPQDARPRHTTYVRTTVPLILTIIITRMHG